MSKFGRRVWGPKRLKRNLVVLTLISILYCQPFGYVQAAAGDLDLSFGNGGKVITNFSGGNDFAYDVAIQEDQKLVVVGTDDRSDPSAGFALARYNPDGSLDSSFGDGGIILTDFGSTGDSALAVAVQRDGKIVAIGRTAPVFDYDFAVARYEGDGLGFDICLQGENRGHLLQINSTTGDYLFTSCDGLTINGIGTLTVRGCTITLRHNAPDSRVMAMVDTCRSRGTATVQTFSPRRTINIADLDITGSCGCGE